MLLCGSQSDPILLSSCIHHSHLRTTSCQLILHDSLGQPKTLMARFFPYYDTAGRPPACRIAVSVSEALTLPDVLAANSLPNALVSSDESHEILLSSPPFSATFSIPSDQLVGQPLRSIFAAGDGHGDGDGDGDGDDDCDGDGDGEGLGDGESNAGERVSRSEEAGEGEGWTAGRREWEADFLPES